MKKFILLLILSVGILALPQKTFSQAHLGSSLETIKKMHPDNTFKPNFTTAGVKYVTTDMNLGLFAYYFNSKGLTDMCVQIPYDMKCLNAQVEIYNKKYVIVNEKSWKAYLDGGYIMKIELEYDSDNEVYSFVYTDNI